MSKKPKTFKQTEENPKNPKEFIKKNHTPKSPSNSRIFTEASSKNIFLRDWKLITISFIVGILITAIGYVMIDIYIQYKTFQLQEGKRQSLISEKQKWEKILASHPDYRDSYVKLALLEYQMGEREKAQIYLEKALEIDPNHEQARSLYRQFLEE